MSIIRLQNAALAAALVVASFCGSALAQSYPSKPIRLVLPFPAAGPSDIVGRVVGQKLAEQLGENVVPDNRVGAGGSVGIAAVTKAPPDGYTVLVVSAAIAIIPSLYANLSYDALRDLAPVARLATIENVLLVHPSVPAKTLRQFVTLARANPGKLNYGSGGPGTTNHLANELLKNLEKINMVHVPYKGATLATVALIGGEVDEVIVSVASALPMIQTGKVRPLAVLSERRVATLPDVPTAKESGVDDFLMSIWYGMFAPAGTPREIISRLNREIMKALESPAMRERMAAAGIDPWPGTPEQMAGLLRSETARFAKIIESAGLKKN
ncbi:MAG: tripartite tricarboxylate transporter substrate binding protein [Betaproteobacteria bacterium]|nr:tripartite tricarboxylate transporter substrate binding protein [Betaproteobacteria bacterium]MBI2291524.1 tripartite tricarboxylate transporter substrate binding protein [Betaproteobacteria bacterium]